MISRFLKHNALWWILSAFVSVLMWSYVVFVQDQERIHLISDIAVQFVGESTVTDRNLRVVEGRGTLISLNVRGRVSDLTKINRDNVMVTVDLSNVTTVGTHNLAYRIELPNSVADNVTPERISDYVRVTFDQVTSLRVPVKFELQGNIAEDYLALPAILEPETVKITGPTNVLDTISYALAVLERTEVDKTVDKIPVRYVLMTNSNTQVSMDGLETDVEEIRVTVPIHLVKSVPLAFNFIDGGGLVQDNNIICRIEPESVTISGDPGVLEEINSIKLDTIDLAKLPGDIIKDYTITYPDNTQSASGEISAKATLSVTGVETKKVTVTDIELINASPPDGYRVELFTKQVSVTLRGSGASIEAVRAGNVRVVLDLANANLALGRQTEMAKVIINGYDDVGAVGDYPIFIDVTEDTEDVVE